MRMATAFFLLVLALIIAPGLPAAEPGRPGGRRGPGRDAISIIPDLPYAGSENPRQRLDLFLPRQPAVAGKLPLVVFIHGGGWQKGDRRSGLGMLAPLVASGRYAGASIGYRLTDEARWPAQIHDCKAAIRWLRGNADRHGLDADRIAVVGTSAGGHLAAMLGTSGEVTEFEGDLGGFSACSSRVQCVVDFFGPSDLTAMGGWHDGPDSPEARLLGGPVGDNKESARDASPIQYVSSDDPPFLIIHGTADRIVPFDQSVTLQRKLAAVGASALLIPIAGGGHGRFRQPELSQRIAAFLENKLSGGDLAISTDPIPATPR